MKKIYIIGIAAVLFGACKPNASINKPVTKGTADFTNYMAIGSTYTAGFADNSLYASAQLNSYPERLFEQFSLVGAKGPFIQPLLPGEYGFPRPKKVLAYVHSPCNYNDSTLEPINYPYPLDSPGSMHFVSNTNHGQVNNIGVPGLRVVDFPVAGYSAPNVNIYASRFFYPNSSTPMDELRNRVGNLNPTFFTLWLGMEDVLDYAVGGGQGDGSGNASPQALNFYSVNDISPLTVWQTLYDSVVKLSISTGSNGALINIPDITAFPFFTALPPNGLILNTQDEVDAMNAKWNPGGSHNFSFQLGANYFVIQQHDGATRQAVPTELILLTVPDTSIKCHSLGGMTPIPAQYVLTTDELQNIRTMITKMNAFIQNEADQHHLAYVDMNSYMRQLSTGMTYNGINYSTQFVAGGAFSLDGITLTERGYALISNEILRTINNFFHANIPFTDVNKYHGVVFP
jgi:hypothetical protein